MTYGARDDRLYQQVRVLDGALDVTVVDDRRRLRTGDCLVMQLDRPTMFHDPTRRTARHAAVVATEPATRR